MKDHGVYSTIDGAKSCAKTLKRVLDERGFLFPLHKCQRVVARAGGFRDWRDLETTLKTGERKIDAKVYEGALLKALPQPARPAVQAWLDKEPAPAWADVPYAYWIIYVLPYVMAMSALHRRMTLLRPGSGVGQRLRERLIQNLIMDVPGGRPDPRLEPDTASLVFEGDLATLFVDDVKHPRFSVEFEALVQAGVLTWDGRLLRVLPPRVDTIIDEVVDSAIGLAQHWSDGEGHVKELAEALAKALAAIGVRNAARLAKAIAEEGSSAYTNVNGSILTLLSEQAHEGELETLARTVALFAELRPSQAEIIRSSLPAKITAQYLPRHLGLSGAAIATWAARRPRWAEELVLAARTPEAFVRQVNAMAAAIRQAA